MTDKKKYWVKQKSEKSLYVETKPIIESYLPTTEPEPEQEPEPENLPTSNSETLPQTEGN